MQTLSMAGLPASAIEEMQPSDAGSEGCAALIALTATPLVRNCLPLAAAPLKMGC
jgi:hypothetical protein